MGKSTIFWQASTVPFSGDDDRLASTEEGIMILTMTRAEREAFLADTHVAIISVAADGRGPLAVPVWYGYEPGGVVRVVTGGTSRKAALIRAAGRVSLCVQSE